MYKGMEGYTDPSRYNEQPRVSGVVETSELSNYPELGPLGKGVSKQYANREPRFYASVGFDRGVWYGNSYSDPAGDQSESQAAYRYPRNRFGEFSSVWNSTWYNVTFSLGVSSASFHASAAINNKSA